MSLFKSPTSDVETAPHASGVGWQALSQFVSLDPKPTPKRVSSGRHTTWEVAELHKMEIACSDGMQSVECCVVCAATAGASAKKLTRAQKKREKEEHEEHIRQRELARVSDSASQPESAEDFERLVMGQPNNSLGWIQYMAFLIALGEIDKARGIAEKALATINYRYKLTSCPYLVRHASISAVKCAVSQTA